MNGASIEIGDVLAGIAPGPSRERARSRDLADEHAADPSGTLTTWRVPGFADVVEVLYYGPRSLPALDGDWCDEWLSPGRAGIDTGHGARWIDADSPREALARFLCGWFR